MPLTVALIGDYSPEKIAHRAIPRAVELAAAAEGIAATTVWVNTSTLRDAARDLAPHSALWVVPGSPYANTAGVFAAIRWAREMKRPLLGSCGGFQHMLIEYARNRAGISTADHAETNPGAAELVITALSCGLVEKTGGVSFVPGSRLREIYGRDSSVEGYHCNYGVNAAYRAALEAAGVRFTSFDEAGDIRAAELPLEAHPFYFGTLFQSERAALRGEVPPLARALVRAAAAFRA